MKRELDTTQLSDYTAESLPLLLHQVRLVDLNSHTERNKKSIGGTRGVAGAAPPRKCPDFFILHTKFPAN